MQGILIRRGNKLLPASVRVGFAWALFAGFGNVYLDFPVIEHFSVQQPDGGFRLFLIIHRNESKSLHLGLHTDCT
jgi:hypothetical protein